MSVKTTESAAKAEKLLLMQEVKAILEINASLLRGKFCIFLQSLFHQLTEQFYQKVPSLEYSYAEKGEKATLPHLVYFYFFYTQKCPKSNAHH